MSPIYNSIKVSTLFFLINNQKIEQQHGLWSSKGNKTSTFFCYFFLSSWISKPKTSSMFSPVNDEHSMLGDLCFAAKNSASSLSVALSLSILFPTNIIVTSLGGGKYLYIDSYSYSTLSSDPAALTS